jgi:hypothetical protein
MTDVPRWIAGAVNWITDPVDRPPIATGFPDRTYRPSESVTRGQLTRMLYRLSLD